ncbi:MAG TPA: purine-nucleoside phosphorylase [Gemmatimonadales bacterium]|nr:purine-nucleoside phosphorylase [Gemmatimonadales bacterium]
MTVVAPATAIDEAAAAIRTRLEGRAPSVAIVLGSGLGKFAERLERAVRIPYSDIPHFPAPTVIGHSGELVAGTLAGHDVLVQSGRFHMYEGHPASLCALPVRVFGRLGVGSLVLTNAAGGIRRSFGSGTVMLIADQINLTFRNGLFGGVLPGEERFPDMSDPYDPGLRALARETARRLRIPLAEGVYVGLLGPSYETPAEIRMLERLGADAVGMSTVIETITARAAGIRCLGFSAITNPAAGVTPHKLHHLEVMEVAYRIAGELAALIEGVVAEL